MCFVVQNHLGKGALRAPVASPTPWRASGIEPSLRQRTVSPVHITHRAWRRPSPPATNMDQGGYLAILKPTRKETPLSLHPSTKGRSCPMKP